jgi:hypothetical protein
MASHPNDSRRRSIRVARAGASWLALVAATHGGLGAVDQLRADVAVEGDFGEPAEGTTGYRLIVQSYLASELGPDQLPSSGARPLGAAQRAVTVDELRRGVSVSIIGVDGAVSGGRVLAWVERGEADFGFDPAAARPLSGAFVGVSRPRPKASGAARVLLRRRVS